MKQWWSMYVAIAILQWEEHVAHLTTSVSGSAWVRLGNLIWCGKATSQSLLQRHSQSKRRKRYVGWGKWNGCIHWKRLVELSWVRYISEVLKRIKFNNYMVININTWSQTEDDSWPVGIMKSELMQSITQIKVSISPWAPSVAMYTSNYS